MSNTEKQRPEMEDDLSQKPPIGHVEMSGGNGPEHERMEGDTIKNAGTSSAHSTKHD